MNTDPKTPAPSGAPRGEIRQGNPVEALGAPEGVFFTMNMSETPPVGSMDYYREMAKTNPDIAALVGMIDKQGKQLVKALEVIVELQSKQKAAAKILTPEAA